MPGRIIDISSNNHPAAAPIVWPLVKRAGVTTAIIKATEGTGYTNPFYAGDVADAQRVGIDVLAYHFAGTGRAQEEAAFFQSVAGRLARVLDVETAKNVQWDRLFLQTLGWAPDQCMTYGSASTLVDFYQQLSCRAWPAAYGQGYPGWGVLWQFTDNATIPGISGPVDENRWYGSEIQYETLFGLLEPPPPVPVPPLPIKEETMGICQGANGKLYIEGASNGTAQSPANNLLLFEVTPGQPYVVNNVIDLTNMLKTQGDGEWQVQ